MAVVVASVTLVGTFVLANAQNDVSETETRLLDATVEVDGEIALSHRGGESIPTSELRLIVRNDSGTVYETAFTAGVLDGADDGSFDVGDTARFDDAGLPNGDIRVLIVHDPTGKLLETQRFFGTSFVAGLRSASITNAPIGTADTGTSQTVTLQFSDEMGVPPTVKITGLNRTYDVAPKDGGFQSATTWTGEVTIRDDEEETTARIEVSGAVDATGRSLSTRSSTFDVDTVVPTVTVDQPNGGETIQGGSTYRIEWTANDGGTGVASNSVRLEYSTDGGSSWTTIATDEADDGAYDWSVPAIDSSSVRVRVNATDVAGNTGSDASDSAFTVDSTPPTVTVNQPNGGETLQGGSTYTIEWTASDAGTGVASNSVGLAYSTDSGSSWTTIATDEADDRAYNWSVPTIDSSTVRVRVNATDVAGNVGSDTSDGDLTITSTAPSVTGASIAGAPINVSETGTTRTVTVNFDQPMDTNVPPTVEVRELPNSNDLPVSANPGYVDDTTWKGNVTIPENQDESNARIYVADAESVVGIEMTPDDSNTFYVDTRRPLDPDMATVLTNPINVSNENNVAVEVAFSSPPEAGTVYVQLSDGNGKTVVASGPADTSSSTTTVTGVDVSSLADTPAGATESISATAKIVDAYGNPNNDGGTFTAQDNSVLKDTVKPTVDTVDVSPSPVTNDSRTVTIDITFSERMEQNVDPTVTLTGLDQTYTVTGSQTNRGQSGSAWRGTVTINEDVEGTATVEITDALDEGLNGMDPDTSTTFAVDTRTPVISNFAATATGQAVEISFESDQQLATVSVDVNDDGGNNEETLTRTDFTESGTGPYTYNATFTASEDDTYDATLDAAADGVGNDGASGQTASVVVDSTPPSVSGVAITDDTDGDGIVTDGDAVQVTATVTDANGVASVTADASAFGAGSVSLADDGPNSGSGDDQYSATFTVGSSPGDGTRSVTVSATDEAGNGGAQAVQSGTLVVDTTAPSALSIDAPTAETFRQSGESVDVTYSYTDANPDSVTIILADGSGNRGTYTIDDTDYAGDDTGKTVTFDLASPDSTDGSGLVDGATYDITVSATDAVGQSTSTTGANLVTIDDTPPTLDGASRVDDTTINVTVSDATTGLDTTSIEKADFYVDVGSIASIDTSGISDGDTTGTVTVNLASAVDSDTVIVGIGGGAGGLTDLVGNAQRTDSAIVSGMDGVAPTFDAASKINTSAIKIVLGDGVGVDESTIAAGDFALNGSATLANVSVTENGTGADVVLRFDPVDQKNIQVDITSAIDDTSGNSLGSGSKVVSDMDGVAPTITGPNPADGATLSDASPTYTVDVTDAGVGVDLSTLRVTVTDSSGTVLDNVGTGDGAVSFSDGTLTIDGPAYADGQVDVTVDADDNAGNAAPQFTSTFTVDTTAPTVTSITRDSPGSTVTNGDSVTFAVAFSESVAGIDTADFDVNTGGSVSASITGVSASSGTSVDVTMSSITGDGSLGLNVASGTDITDDAGNTLDSIEPPTDEIYTIDNTGPTITGVSVSDTIDPDGTAGDGVVNDGDTVRVEATVTDANGVDSVTVDAAAFGAGTVTLTNANGDDVYDAEFAVDAVAASGDGTYQLTVSTTDSVGNANAAQTGGVELDTRAPTISTFDATNPSGKDIKVTIESDEPLSDINVTISKNNNPETTFTEGDFSETGSGPYTYTATYSNNQGGTFTATLNIAEDETGNNGGAGQTSTVSPSGGGGNKAPTADAGSDFSVTEGSTGTLDGSASSSDPSRSITTYEWTITNVNGLSVSINDADTSDPTAVFDATGASVSSPTDVTVELKVTDNEGDTATDTVVVTVIDSGSAATQVSQNGSASQGGEGELVFSLENTGSSTVSITDIQINSFNKNTGNVNIERVNRGGDEFRADSSGKLDQKMDIGISYALDSNADIGDKNTVEFTLGNFQEQSGNSGNYKDVDISGSTIEITIYYADGSSETFSFTP